MSMSVCVSGDPLVMPVSQPEWWFSAMHFCQYNYKLYCQPVHLPHITPNGPDQYAHLPHSTITESKIIYIIRKHW